MQRPCVFHFLIPAPERNNLGVRAATAILGYKQVSAIGGDAIAAVAAFFVLLIGKIYCIVIPEFHLLAARQGV